MDARGFLEPQPKDFTKATKDASARVWLAFRKRFEAMCKCQFVTTAAFALAFTAADLKIMYLPVLKVAVNRDTYFSWTLLFGPGRVEMERPPKNSG